MLTGIVNRCTVTIWKLIKSQSVSRSYAEVIIKLSMRFKIEIPKVESRIELDADRFVERRSRSGSKKLSVVIIGTQVFDLHT